MNKHEWVADAVYAEVSARVTKELGPTDLTVYILTVTHDDGSETVTTCPIWGPEMLRLAEENERLARQLSDADAHQG